MLGTIRTSTSFLSFSFLFFSFLRIFYSNCLLYNFNLYKDRVKERESRSERRRRKEDREKRGGVLPLYPPPPPPTSPVHRLSRSLLVALPLPLSSAPYFYNLLWITSWNASLLLLLAALLGNLSPSLPPSGVTCPSFGCNARFNLKAN